MANEKLNEKLDVASQAFLVEDAEATASVIVQKGGGEYGRFPTVFTL